MTMVTFPLAKQVGRVQSMTLPLDGEQERRFARLMERLVMIDLHEHPIVFPASPDDLGDYLRSNAWTWGYEALRHGGWTAVGTANVLTCLGKTSEISRISFADLVDEIGIMRADVIKHASEATLVGSADDIVRAKECNLVGFLPTLEYLAIGMDIHRIDVLYGIGVRLAGLTYSRKGTMGDGQIERTDAGVSEFGLESIKRMNDLGMVIDLSHAGTRTALDAIGRSAAPVVFSHDGARGLRPNTRRMRTDEELLACVKKGGIVGVCAIPKMLSDDPHQDINCVLDHYDYMVKLLGVDHVAIGTDSLIGGHEGLHKKVMGRDRPVNQQVVYINGLESPADGKNIIRGLIVRGYADDEIVKIAGRNALDLFRRVAG